MIITENPRRINFANIFTPEGGWLQRNLLNYSIIASIFHNIWHPIFIKIGYQKSFFQSDLNANNRLENEKVC